MWPRTWSSITSAMSPLMAPRTDAMSCKTSAHPISSSSARSIASTCPRIRRTRPSSFDFSRTVCVMVAGPRYDIGGYTIEETGTATSEFPAQHADLVDRWLSAATLAIASSRTRSRESDCPRRSSEFGANERLLPEVRNAVIRVCEDHPERTGHHFTTYFEMIRLHVEVLQCGGRMPERMIA